MSKNTLLAFVLGAAAGSVATWYYVKTKYEQIAQEEIESVKDWYEQRYEYEEEDTEYYEEPSEPDAATEMKNEYANILTNAGYTDQEGVEDMNDGPYVIAPEEFGEYEEYETETLTYYTDGVLADEWDNVIENPAELVGDGFENHFDEYEDDPDTVYVRNDELNMYYEIQRDLRSFSDVFGE